MLRICLLTIIIISAVRGYSQNRNHDDSLIYMAILKSTIDHSAKYILIINETIKYEHDIDTLSIVDSNSTDPDEILTRKYEWESTTKTLFDSIAYNPMMRYYLSSHEKIKIAYRFPLPFKVVYLSGAEYELGKDSTEYWDNLDRKYPNSSGLLSFSEIFYSMDRSRAVLYYAVRRKNGKGSILLFQKVNRKWEIQFETKVWHN